MSNTIAHRAHIHIPWTTIAVVLVAALAAAAVLVLINQPADVTVGTAAAPLAAPGAAAMPQIETHTEILALTGRAPGVDAKAAVHDTRHNFPIGVSLDSTGTDTLPTVAPDTRHNFPPGTTLD
jgi:hypothetical protein